VLVPVIGADAVALDQQVADRPIRYVFAGVIDDAGLVARHQLARRARTDATGSVGDENVQDLGAADAIEDLKPESILEAFVEGFGQRLTRRHRLTNAGEIEVGSVPLVREKLPIVGGNRKEE